MVHCRRLGYCARGVRAFYARAGLDYSAFLQDGTPARELLATGDSMAMAAVEEASKDGREQ